MEIAKQEKEEYERIIQKNMEEIEKDRRREENKKKKFMKIKMI